MRLKSFNLLAFDAPMQLVEALAEGEGAPPVAEDDPR
jgi:hypothetical protein